MGKALAAAFPDARAAFEEADTAFAAAGSHGRSLSALCFEGPDDQLMLTEHTQPAILTMSTAAACLQSMATGHEQTPRCAVSAPEADRAN